MSKMMSPLIPNEEFYLELNPQMTSCTQVAEEEFLAWFKGEDKKNKTTKINHNGYVYSKPKNTLYQDIRHLSAYKDKDECLNQSLHNKEERGYLYDLYTSYKQHLKKNQQLDLAFARFTNQEESELYDLIVVDEAQDLSPAQLQELLYLAKEGCIVYCIDSHQSLNDSHSKRPFLLNQMLHLSKLKMHYIALPGSYRLPSVVIDFVNHVLVLKFIATGGLADKKEFSVIGTMEHTKLGSIEWHTPISAQGIEFKNDTSVAVITLSQYKEEAKKRFNTPLVFTPQESKGLEYDTVILFNLLNDPVFRSINTLIAKEYSQEHSKKTINQPKNNAGNDEFVTPFNHFITAAKRTSNRLVVVQEEEHSRLELIEALKEGLPKKLQEQPKTQEFKIFTNENTPEVSWEEEGHKLLRLGKLDQARAIFVEKLGKTEEEFKAYLQPEKPQEVKPTPSNTKVNTSPDLSKKSTQAEKTNKKPVTVVQKAVPVSKQPIALSQELKEKKYLFDLFNNFNEKRLVELFERKDYSRLLWDVIVVSHEGKQANLFLALVFDIEKLPIFTKFLEKQKKYHSKFTSDLLYKRLGIPGNEYEDTSLMYWFAFTDFGQKLLLEMFKKKPATFAGITANVLCGGPRDGMEHSLLYSMCLFKDLLRLLDYLLEQNPRLIQDIPLWTWIALPQDEKESALSIVRRLKTEGGTYAKRIFDKCPKAFQTLTKELEPLVYSLIQNPSEDCLRQLFNHKEFDTLMTQLPISSAHTLGSVLFTREHGTLTVIDFLNKNPEYVAKLTPEVLSKPFSLKGHNLDNSSLLFLFLLSIEGVSLLTTFPKLLKGITTEALCRRASPKIDDLSPLNLIASFYSQQTKALTKEGNNYLLEVFAHLNPNVFLEITKDHLCHIGLEQKNSVLDCLYAFAENHDFLKRLVTQNQGLLKDIPKSAWQNKPAETGLQIMASPITSLHSTASGTLVAGMISALYPDLQQESNPCNTSLPSRQGFFSNETSVKEDMEGPKTIQQDRSI